MRAAPPQTLRTLSVAPYPCCAGLTPPRRAARPMQLHCHGCPQHFPPPFHRAGLMPRRAARRAARRPRSATPPHTPSAQAYVTQRSQTRAAAQLLAQPFLASPLGAHTLPRASWGGGGWAREYGGGGGAGWRGGVGAEGAPLPTLQERATWGGTPTHSTGAAGGQSSGGAGESAGPAGGVGTAGNSGY